MKCPYLKGLYEMTDIPEETFLQNLNKIMYCFYAATLEKLRTISFNGDDFDGELITASVVKIDKKGINFAIYYPNDENMDLILSHKDKDTIHYEITSSYLSKKEYKLELDFKVNLKQLKNYLDSYDCYKIHKDEEKYFIDRKGFYEGTEMDYE